MRIDPGQLRTELTLQVMTPQSDGAGGHAEQWNDVASVWALVEPAAARDRFGADQRLPELTHRVTIRFRGDVRGGMRFAWGGRTLVIRTAHDPDETGRFLLCRTEEEGR
ncbi:MAG TPA: phage head closure protein [Mesorhizobium sp.]|jgi:SPP1 family predicted phage head-tail adaptor|nr:phage head closure protein [Mesorhizobium sp.]